MGVHQSGPRFRCRLIGTLRWTLPLGLAVSVLGCSDPRTSDEPALAMTTGASDSTWGPEPSTSISTTGSTTSEDSTASGSTESSTGDTPSWPPDIAPLEDGELRPGGDTTTDVFGVGAFVQEAANLSLLRRAQFEAGLQFFQLNWESAPGVAALDGLGPTYNATSCSGCHARNGRGHPPGPRDPDSPGVLLRLRSARGIPDPRYGDQLQPRSIPGVAAEGRLETSPTSVRTIELDQESVTLSQMGYSVPELSFGPLAASTAPSARIAMQLVGGGLLEAISQSDIVAWEDPQDRDGDGISGRAAWLSEAQLGRFGWKASQATVRSQTAAAFLGDLGITTDVRSSNNCPSVQTACADAPTGGSPELSSTRLDATAAYVRLLGVPARRGGDTQEVLQGKALFNRVGCGRCHRAHYTTHESTEPELSAQMIWPYSDLLLHDMGDGLADGSAEGAASDREWRTAPLWGLGLVEAVNGTRELLHDGRARTLAEAILWHAGEAEGVTAAYAELSAEQRRRLHEFVESL